MLKDIIIESMEGVGIAVVHEFGDHMEMVWNVYAINYTHYMLEGVLVSTKGYGIIDGIDKTTTALRHFLDKIEPLSYLKIEPIQEELFALTNEFWMSYYAEGKMYEKKYIIDPGSINPEKTENVSLLNKQGYLQI
ncbi:MAG: hypothetical protein H7296_14055 [Bacteroidia bacterium]|nr:hypothetical protein [Bacteroidia bacterium]